MEEVEDASIDCRNTIARTRNQEEVVTIARNSANRRVS
jgi:hypothetical protein